MAIVATGSAVSVAANSKSSDQVSGQFQFTGRGIYRLYARASATGLNVTFAHGGISPINDLVIPYTGAAGGLSKVDHLVVEQVMGTNNGERNELTFRNTTGGAITVDYTLEFLPTK